MFAAEYPDTTRHPVRLTTFPQTELGGNYDEMIAEIERIPADGISLERREFLGLQGGRTIVADFTERPEAAKSRRDSAHNVYFGQLMINSTYDYELPTPVAVKPYDEDTAPQGTPAKSLAHEWAANEYVGRLSQYERAYLPLGVWKDEGGAPQLVTLFDEPTKTFQDIFWATGKEVDRINKKIIMKAIDMSMYAIGVLHGAGLAHGDTAVRNLARDSNHVRFVDLETVSMLPRDGSEIRDSLATKRQVNGDINQFISSLLMKNDSRPNYTFEKVASVLTKERAASTATGRYWLGLAQGQLRNGTEFPENLVIQPEDLLDRFKFAIEIVRTKLREGSVA